MKKRKLLYNKNFVNIVYALSILVFGFILLNLTFLVYALYNGLIMGFIGLFINLTPETNIFWLPPLLHLSFLVIIGVISWFIFKSRLKVIYKAVYLAIPVAVVLVTIGIFLSNFPIILYPLGTLIVLGILFYLYYKKQSWLYYYTVILFSLILTVYTLMGGEI